MNIIKYFSTTRYLTNGFSTGNYANFNLATHTGDNLDLVSKNQKLLVQKYQLPQMPKWLEQTHSNIILDDKDSGNFADGIITKQKGVVCAILTADCLPIFAWNKNKTIVGVAHAGWQGIYNGVIQSFVQKFNTNPQELNIAFGTALGIDNFIVDTSFYQDFIKKNPDFSQCFIRFENKYKFDIYKSAILILNKLGVTNIIQNSDCTFSNKNLFSYRRDGKKSGRQSHLILIGG